MRCRLMWFAVAVALPGCTFYRPEDISGPKVKIEDAFDGVAKGLRKFQASLSDKNGEGEPLFLGVRTCKIIVQFNVSVQAADKGTAGVTLGYAPYVELNGGKENTSGANAGNLVTVELDSTDTAVCQAPAKAADDPKPATQRKPGTPPPTRAGDPGPSSLELARAAAALIGTPQERYLSNDAKTGKLCLHRKGQVFAQTIIPTCSGDL